MKTFKKNDTCKTPISEASLIVMGVFAIITLIVACVIFKTCIMEMDIKQFGVFVYFTFIAAISNGLHYIFILKVASYKDFRSVSKLCIMIMVISTMLTYLYSGMLKGILPDYLTYIIFWLISSILITGLVIALIAISTGVAMAMYGYTGLEDKKNDKVLKMD